MPERPSVGELLRGLGSRGLFDERTLPAVAERLREPQEARALPLHLQALTGVGAWVAGVFFIAFLLVLGGWKEQAFLVEGLILIGMATGLRAISDRVFAAQFALALSMAGHVFALVGVDHTTVGALPVAAASVVLCAVLYPLYRDPVHRFLSCLTALSVTEGWLAREGVPLGLAVLALAAMAGLGALFLKPAAPRALRPLGFALAAALPSILALPGFRELKGGTPEVVLRVILMAGLAGLIVAVSEAHRGGSREPALVAIGATLLLGTFTAPGLLGAIGLLVLGYHRPEKLLVGLGVASLVYFLWDFYYSLDLNLGLKSALLAGSGALLLGARMFLGRRPWARKEAA